MIKIRDKIIERSQKVGSRKNFFKNKKKVWRKRSRKKIKNISEEKNTDKEHNSINKNAITNWHSEREKKLIW